MRRDVILLATRVELFPIVDGNFDVFVLGQVVKFHLVLNFSVDCLTNSFFKDVHWRESVAEVCATEHLKIKRILVKIEPEIEILVELFLGNLNFHEISYQKLTIKAFEIVDD